MSVNENTRHCLFCDKRLRGRSDKKFCDDSCRNNYNNSRKTKDPHIGYVRGINSVLLKNRKVLESILREGEETAKATRERLLRLGFQFMHLTHLYTTRNGKVYYYCYDYGYLPLENDWYLVVKQREE